MTLRLRLPSRALQSLALLLMLIGTMPVLHAQDFSSLEERMSHAEFVRLGLDKLSPEQLAGLNAWLRTHGNRGPAMDAAPRSADAAPMPAEPTRETIHSQLAGDFSGWRNGTVFALENGQRWQVSDDSDFDIRTLSHPDVTIKPGFLGSWLLSVDGVREIAHVRPAGPAR